MMETTRRGFIKGTMALVTAMSGIGVLGGNVKAQLPRTKQDYIAKAGREPTHVSSIKVYVNGKEYWMPVYN